MNQIFCNLIVYQAHWSSNGQHFDQWSAHRSMIMDSFMLMIHSCLKAINEKTIDNNMASQSQQWWILTSMISDINDQSVTSMITDINDQ